MLYLKQIAAIAVLAFTLTACQKGEQKTKNGYNYTIHKSGSGQTPKENDFVFFTVKILGDTTLIQDSQKQGEDLPYLQIPKDWAKVTPPSQKVPLALYDIFTKSSLGESFTLHIPVDSMPQGDPMLQGKKFINYEFTVKEIRDSIAMKKYGEMKEAARAKKAEAASAQIPAIQKTLNDLLAQYKAKTLKLEKTASGLQYFIQEKGTGPVAKQGEQVTVDYYGVLTNGTEFDNSFKRGEPIKFGVGTGSVIPGWDEILMLLPKGSKAVAFIPSKLGYGEQASGPIPANSELVFYMDVK